MKIIHKLKVSDLGEFGLIEKISRLVNVDKSVICGIGDDSAAIKIKNDTIILFTTDMLIEDVHFNRKMNPFAIGHKALACSISDIAAMGGLPKYAVVSLGIPKDLNFSIVNDVYRGLINIARKFGINIVGGDTNASNKIIINVSLLGEVERQNLIKRNKAKIGDLIFVTGSLGKSFEDNKHLNFIPHIKEARFLVRNCKPTSMIDISDGLVIDLYHILEESRAGAIIYENAIPKTKDATIKNALYDGEDYELLFTLNRKNAQYLLRNKNIRNKLKTRFTLIGEITSKKIGLKIIDKFNKVKILKPKGFTHF